MMTVYGAVLFYEFYSLGLLLPLARRGDLRHMAVWMSYRDFARTGLSVSRKYLAKLEEYRFGSRCARDMIWSSTGSR